MLKIFFLIVFSNSLYTQVFHSDLEKAKEFLKELDGIHFISNESGNCERFTISNNLEKELVTILNQTIDYSYQKEKKVTGVTKLRVSSDELKMKFVKYHGVFNQKKIVTKIEIKTLNHAIKSAKVEKFQVKGFPVKMNYKKLMNVSCFRD